MFALVDMSGALSWLSNSLSGWNLGTRIAIEDLPAVTVLGIEGDFGAMMVTGPGHHLFSSVSYSVAIGSDTVARCLVEGMRQIKGDCLDRCLMFRIVSAVAKVPMIPQIVSQGNNPTWPFWRAVDTSTIELRCWVIIAPLTFGELPFFK